MTNPLEDLRKVVEIWFRKRRARGLYRQIERNLDTVGCGISLLCTMRPDFAKLVSAFDREIAWLEANNPVLNLLAAKALTDAE